MSFVRPREDQHHTTVDDDVLCSNMCVCAMTDTHAGFLITATVSAIYMTCPITKTNARIAGHKIEVGMCDGIGDDARFNRPGGLVMDEKRHLVFFTDRNNHAVRVLELTNNNRVTTLVGKGKSGYLNGSMGCGMLHTPIGIAMGGSGALYVGDHSNNAIRRIVLNPCTCVCGCVCVCSHVRVF